MKSDLTKKAVQSLMTFGQFFYGAEKDTAFL
jgi:hypothetical protein